MLKFFSFCLLHICPSLYFVSFLQLSFQHILHLTTYLTCEEFSVHYVVIGFETLLNEIVHCVVIDEGSFGIERVCDSVQTPSFASSPYEIHAPLAAAGGQHVLQTFLVVLCVFAHIFLEFFQERLSTVTVKIYVFLLLWCYVNSNPVTTSFDGGLFVHYV